MFKPLYDEVNVFISFNFIRIKLHNKQSFKVHIYQLKSNNIPDEDQIHSKYASKEINIMNELSWGTKIKLLKDDKPNNRRVGISMLQMPDTAEVKKTESRTEDDSMKMKLFRLMYETVRDSDTKVKRAELIKAHYTNYTTFEFGFIVGDLLDKFNVMSDIAVTTKRLYKDWKPMEHINAYEQIANKAIEINHLIDMIKVINKKGVLSNSK